MKRSQTTAILFTLFAVYLLNVFITIGSLDATPAPEMQLEPEPIQKVVPPNRQLHDDDLASNLPIYTKEMAAQAIRPAPWTCGNPKDSSVDSLSRQKPIFGFVHIFKTAGSTMRTYFKRYAYICGKAWMCLISCTKVKPSSIASDQSNWGPCRVKTVFDRNRRVEEEDMDMPYRVYAQANNIVIRDNIDIFGGHFRIGTGDYILDKGGEGIHPIRYIIFLRNPVERFVSGVLFDNRTNKDYEKLSFVVQSIKKLVRGDRAAGEYWNRSLDYLLTPMQAEEFQSKRSDLLKSKSLEASQQEQFAAMKARTGIDNLMKYNAIVGMTEQMNQSMEILQHILLTNAKPRQVSRLDEVSNTTKNTSKGQVSTSSVLEELRKDVEFMSIFEEYLKFEKMINDFAMNMHMMQYEQVAT